MITGIHAAAAKLHTAPCHVWFSQATYAPPMDVVAAETITWTDEADATLKNVPETARAMVRHAIMRYAQESGHTCITSALIEEATNRFCPHSSGKPTVNR